MLIIVLASAVLVVATSFIHYEVLRGLNAWLPRVRVPRRALLVVVILCAFLAHAAEMALYGLSFWVLIGHLGQGAFTGGAPSLASALYFSAETYTSLGFGDLTPMGPVRLLAGVEALNGLLLIGWSASFTYLCMERFWADRPAE